ncbi:energy-coupling factor transport system permease protein [Nocardioides luteus]|uniref:Cobalt ABC transporter permease n=1 Tax=Nocardioides luteus TaxID=1844 RepID=A0ABQ5STQ7_9ACTN|nr:energy-coupling factor transporter transmembrane component T [Nocardioides luteus]MDR7309691.1 energy-coupling factor transport system permease protein [Nocardioides luteus]GGR61964.1 cobalt ABC transporter permease [Nocardioides luteus]GLJ67400.1 cobalt ABC transporter permease [Nocardioides luteus]
MSSLLRTAAVARLPRDLHPVAWWVWAIGLAAYASFTTNPLLLLLLVGVVSVVVAACRGEQLWAKAFRLYAGLALFIVVTRVLFRVLLGAVPGHVILDLPEIPLPEWVLGIRLLGPLTREALLAGLYDGMRLGAIVLCVGAANALANPKRLLRSLPPALYEIGTAVVVAVTVLPQLAESVQRVRAAQRLRAGATGKVRRLRRFLVPVLEDALERSMALAAGMDTRGYGRTAGLPAATRRVTSTLMLVSLVGLCVGVYAILDGTTPGWLAATMLGLGAVAAAGGLTLAGRRVTRTVYRPDRWRWPEVVVALSGVVVAAAGWWIARDQVPIAFPAVSTAPQVTLVAMAGVLVGLAPALAAPAPASPLFEPVSETVSEAISKEAVA